MAIQKINLGTEPHGVGGDSYRTANEKINSNFDEVGKDIKGVLDIVQDGDFAKSAYDIAVKNGFVGSESAWLSSLIGKKGEKGVGVVNVIHNNDDTLTFNFTDNTSYTTRSLKGEQGIQGPEGKSVYDIAVSHGFEGDEKDWLNYILENSETVSDLFADAGSLEQFVNGSEDETVLTRLSAEYPTLQKAIKELFENGGIADRFKTLAELQTSDLVDGSYALVADDIDAKNGIYIKEGGAWVKSKYDNTLKIYRDEVIGVMVGDIYVSPTSSRVVFDAESNNYKTYKFKVARNTEYDIKLTGTGNERFRVALVQGDNDNKSDVRYLSLINDTTTVRDLQFNSGDADELYIYLGTRTMTTIPTVAPSIYNTDKPIYAHGLTKKLVTNDIADRAITSDKTDFIYITEDTKELKQSRAVIKYNASKGGMYLAYSAEGQAYIAPLDPYERINIKLTDGDNQVFRVAVMNSEKVVASGDPVVDKAISEDVNLREVEFVNDELGKWVVISLASSAQQQTDVMPIVTSKRSVIAGLTSSNLRESYNIKFGKLPNTTQTSPSDKVTYPRLACVKYAYTDNKHPEPVGYLYTSNEAPYELYYSSGVPDNMVKIADWDMSLTRDGNRTPSQHTLFIADSGDIICLHRGDLNKKPEIDPRERQNPIIYPAGDYNNPVVVDLGDGIKPTGWARCNGVTSIPNKDHFVFSEYTRLVHEYAYIWKVDYPYTDPSSWTTVFNYLLPRNDKTLKHFHATNYDPFSGAIVASVGDRGYGAKILMSLDKGVTWVEQASGDESKCRLSQFIFDKDYIYWGSDSYRTQHVFCRAPRDEDGYPMLKLEDIEIVHIFGDAPATYNTVRLHSPNGLLFLDRHDTLSTEVLNLYFYSLDSETMYDISSIYKMPDVMDTEQNGFRCDTVCLYQPYTDDRIVVGFNAISASNAMDVAGNSVENRAHNLTIEIDTTLT